MTNRFNNAVFLQKPYPSIDIKSKNKAYAYLLSQAYCGSDSEMTAVCTYSYNHIVLDSDKDSTVSKIFGLVAQTEMLHMEMLGKMIYQLGEMPVYAAANMRKMQIWSAKNITYNSTASSILRAAIASEERGIMEYRRLISLISDRSITDVLERIILDEEHHIALFSELLAEKRM